MIGVAVSSNAGVMHLAQAFAIHWLVTIRFRAYEFGSHLYLLTGGAWLERVVGLPSPARSAFYQNQCFETMRCMMRFIAFTLFAVNLAGCTTKTSVTDGSGFELLSPSSETRSFIITNDQQFARQVAAHNRTCNSQPGCRK